MIGVAIQTTFLIVISFLCLYNYREGNYNNAKFNAIGALLILVLIILTLMTLLK